MDINKWHALNTTTPKPVVSKTVLLLGQSIPD